MLCAILMSNRAPAYTFYEFFAGGGMARAGLGPGWRCAFANDMNPMKARIYAENWGGEAMKVADVSALNVAELPGVADLVWASFPCQDLSLAGEGAGLGGARSGAFWPFWRLIEGLGAAGRSPRTIVLENVCGAFTARGGKDFEALIAAIDSAAYDCGALVIDAAHFVPQSRPRLFLVAVRRGLEVPATLFGETPGPRYTTLALERACASLPPRLKAALRWWRLPPAQQVPLTLSAVLEDSPNDVRWKTPDEVHRLLGMMSEVNRAKVAQAQRARRRKVGAVYRRTRVNEAGEKVQRAEVRFDDVSGCLRTPAGGSSRQLLLIVEGPRVRARLVSARETARLMGLPDSYVLPANYSDAYHLTGDGVVVPAVRHLAAHLLEPICQANPSAHSKRAA
jgi:DNA (cytosine-5)-methyltransferase 1